MSESKMVNESDANCVRKSVLVEASQAIAWRVFTTQMGTWWPLGDYKIGTAPAVDAVIEPQVGGRWYERGEDGSTCQWGSVLAWDPPSRLVLSWDIDGNWQYDPSLKTELEVRFVATAENTTRVDLEHRHLDRYGDRRDEMRAIFESGGDWGKLLEGFARVTAAQH